MATETDFRSVLNEIIAGVEHREEPDGLSPEDVAELELLRGIQGAAEQGKVIEWSLDDIERRKPRC